MHDAGLIFAMRLDGNGAGTELKWQDVDWDAPGSALWLHFDYQGSGTLEWLRNHAGLPRDLLLALTAEDTRPRLLTGGDALLIILRGINTNPGADSHDMVAVRLVTDGRRVITLRHRRVMSVEDIRRALTGGSGPHNAGQLVADLALRLARRMSGMVQAEIESMDELEDMVESVPSRRLRPAISDSRRKLIALRRYILPQREALSQLISARVTWIDDDARILLQEAADQSQRLAEDLDAARDRAAVVRDELESLVSERMNRTMYVLAMVAAVFLPLGLITGLLGINVAGIPGADNPTAFVLVCLMLLAIAGFEIWIFKKMRWI